MGMSTPEFGMLIPKTRFLHAPPSNAASIVMKQLPDESSPRMVNED
jgi:hypothetical protein